MLGPGHPTLGTACFLCPQFPQELSEANQATSVAASCQNCQEEPLEGNLQPFQTRDISTVRIDRLAANRYRIALQEYRRKQTISSTQLYHNVMILTPYHVTAAPQVNPDRTNGQNHGNRNRRVHPPPKAQDKSTRTMTCLKNSHNQAVNSHHANT